MSAPTAIRTVMHAIWLVMTITGLLAIWTFSVTLGKRAAAQSRGEWWREIHERLRRYPTPEEVEDWMSKQPGLPAP